MTKIYKDLCFWSILTGLLEIGIMNHGFVGWTVVEFVFREEKYFPNATQAEQSLTYSRVASMASLVKLCVSISMSIATYYVSLWNLRFIAMIGTFTASLMLFFESSEHPWIGLVGYALFTGAAQPYRSKSDYLKAFYFLNESTIKIHFIEFSTKTKNEIRKLSNNHIWATLCPTFLLRDTLTDTITYLSVQFRQCAQRHRFYIFFIKHCHSTKTTIFGLYLLA